MKKYLILAALAVFASAGVNAQETQNARPRGGHGGPGGHDGDFMAQLTDEQKACFEGKACPKPEFKEGEKPDEEAMSASRECMRKAYEECGIPMPERPARDEGDRPQFGGKGGPKPEPQE